jgi:hypothetical protein
VRSPITGGDGNVEFLARLDLGGEPRADLKERIHAAIHAIGAPA